MSFHTGMKMNQITSNKEFSGIYVTYFPKMVRFATEYILSAEEAKHIVQDMFLYLWEHPDLLKAVSNMNAFLFTLLKNRCIDYYRHYIRIEAKRETIDNIHDRELHLRMESLQQFDMDMFTENEIEELLERAIANLPEKCRQVFILSRMEGLKHEEIARQLDISVHTVQNHIVVALRKLRLELKDYLPLFLFVL